jgi:TonB family protein
MSSRNIKIFDETGCLSEEALTEYAHGKLGIHLKKQVEIHINECDFCRDALEGISLMKSKESSHAAVAQLNEKIANHGKPQRAGGKVIQMNFLRLAAAIALFFVLGGGVLYVALNPPFKNDVAENKQQEKVLAENKPEVKDAESVLLDSVIEGGVAVLPPDAAPVLEAPAQEDLYKAPLADNNEGFVANGTGNAEAIRKDDDLPADYGTMKATGGASNSAPMFYNPQTVSGQTGYADTVFRFDSDKYVSDGIAANFESENTKSLSAVEVVTASKNKSADKKAQKEADKKAREETTSRTTSVEEAPAVAYDELKVAEEKAEVDQARKNIEQDAQQQNGDTKVYAFADEMPQYPGGNEALKKHIRDNVNYPQTAKEQAVSGTVYISYVVSAAGKVTNVKVWKSVSKDLDNEALRVVSSLKDFTPGKQGGKQVSVQMTIPVKFSLE